MIEFKGIDVSSHQGRIDWAEVNKHIDFAILRCGYGNDIASQDDTRFLENAAACARYGIPYGIYIYSYAKNIKMLQSEIRHTLRLVKGLDPICIYIDMEDSSTIPGNSRADLTYLGLEFCRAITRAGFKAGVYANQNWFRNYIFPDDFVREGYMIWAAKYSSAPPEINAKYDIWQYSSKGKVPGINGNVDMNILYKEEEVKAPFDPEATADRIIAGEFGNGTDRINNMLAAGFTQDEIKAAQNVANARFAKPAKLSAEEIADGMIAGKYGNGKARKDALRKLGYTDAEIKAAQAIVNKRFGR